MQSMPFGKFKGAPLHHLPPDYVSWLRRNVALFDDMANSMERIYGGKFRRKTQDHPRSEPAAIVTTPMLRSMRRKWSARLHPDRGGSREAMALANQIFDEIEEAVVA